MGGLSRKLAYINSLKSEGVEPIVLDAGDALYRSQKLNVNLLESERYKAKSFLKGYETIGTDALNIGGYELAGGYDFLKDIANESGVPIISANLRDIKTGKLTFDPYVIVKRNKLKVGVIGVSNLLPSSETEYAMDDYIGAGQKYIAKLRKKVDVLVMLVNAQMKDKKMILEEFNQADYIFVSRPYSRPHPGQSQKKDEPIWYTAGINAKYLTVIETTINDSKQRIVDRTYQKNRISSLNRQLARVKNSQIEKALQKKQIESYQDQIDKAEKDLSNIKNPSDMKLVGMPQNSAVDKEMQTYVDNCLAKAKELNISK